MQAYHAPAAQQRSLRRRTNLVEWCESITWAAVLMMLVFTFGVRVAQVDGSSMEPTLYHGERVLLSSLPYTPRHGDIIVTDSAVRYGKVLIKRVIGCPGDTIDIDFAAGVVYRNGQPLEEPYAAAPTTLYEGTDFPLTVPAGQLFLMGDNRDHSLDSRSPDVGLVDARDVLGRVLVRILPLNKLGALP